MKKKTYDFFLIFIILIFTIFYSKFIDHGLPYFLNNDENAYLKSTLFFFNFFSSNYKYLSDPFYSPFFNFIGSSFIAVIDAIKNNNLMDIKDHIYFNPNLLIVYGRFTSLIVCSLSLFVISAILNKLKIDRIIILNLIISISFCLFFTDIAITNGKNSFYLLFFFIQYYFLVKYYSKIEKFNFRSYFIFGFIGSLSWGINYFCSIVSITAIIFLHIKKFKFNKLHYFIFFFTIFLIFGVLPDLYFNEVSPIWYLMDTSNPNNFTLIDRIDKFQSNFFTSVKIIYFTEKYYFFLFLIILIFYIKSKKFRNRSLFFFSAVLLLEPLFLLMTAKVAFPQLKYFSASIVLLYILFGLGLNEILRIYKKKKLIIFFIMLNLSIIFFKLSQIDTALNIISAKNNFYNVYEKELNNIKKTLYFSNRILIRKNLNNLILYKELYKNDLIKEKWYLKDNLNSLNLKIKKFDQKYFGTTPTKLESIIVLESHFKFKNLDKLFELLNKKKGFEFIVIPDEDNIKSKNKKSDIIKYIEKNFEMVNFYEGNNLRTPRDVIEQIYFGEIVKLKGINKIGSPYKVYKLSN